MAMIRCPICGERYSDTYKYCPFCEEEEAYEDGEEIRRYPQGRGRGARQPNLITPTLIILIVIMAALLIYLLWGDKIASKFKGGDDEPDNPGVSDGILPEELTPSGTTPDDTNPDSTGTPDISDAPDTPDSPGGSTPDGTMPEDPDTSTSGGTASGDVPSASGTGSMSYAAAAALPSGLSLSSTDFTRSVSEGTHQLRVSGGNGTYTWISEDPGIASVDSSGTVTPISAGTTHIAVTDGSRRAICIVRVTGSSSGGSSGGSTTTTTTPATSSGGSLKTGSAVVVNGGNGVRVRSGPGTSYDILASIPNGGAVQIVRSAENGWYEITFSNVGGVTTTGYMLGDYLSNT